MPLSLTLISRGLPAPHTANPELIVNADPEIIEDADPDLIEDGNPRGPAQSPS